MLSFLKFKPLSFIQYKKNSSRLCSNDSLHEASLERRSNHELLTINAECMTVEYPQVISQPTDDTSVVIFIT